MITSTWPTAGLLFWDVTLGPPLHTQSHLHLPLSAGYRWVWAPGPRALASATSPHSRCELRVPTEPCDGPGEALGAKVHQQTVLPQQCTLLQAQEQCPPRGDCTEDRCSCGSPGQAGGRSPRRRRCGCPVGV